MSGVLTPDVPRPLYYATLQYDNHAGLAAIVRDQTAKAYDSASYCR